MENVFSRIFTSRPNTLVTFGASGAISNGFSPLTHTASSLTYRMVHALPGSKCYVAEGAGSIQFTGRLSSAPARGGQGSIEIIRMQPSAVYSALSESILSVPGFIELTRQSQTSGTLPAIYTLTVGGVSYPITAGVAHGIEHIVVNINGSTVSVFLNGLRTDCEVPSDAGGSDINSVGVYPRSGQLIAVVLRPAPVAYDYVYQVYELLTSFPSVADADSAYDADSFYFDKSMLRYEHLVRLEDIDFIDESRDSLMYTGSLLTEVDESGGSNIMQGNIPLPNPTDADSVISETVGLTSFNSIGDAGLDPLPLTTGVDSTLTKLNKSTNGEPVLVSMSVNSLSTEETPLQVNAYYMPVTVSMTCQSNPELTCTVDPSSKILGWSGSYLFGGGVQGVVYVEPDPSAIEASDYCEAYGVWVCVNAAGNIAKSPVFNVALNSSLGVTSTGVSNLYVDGVAYSSGAITKGWHFISFIPSSKGNGRVEVGSAGMLVRSFSGYHLASPSTYMASLYASYVDPTTIKSSSSDKFSIAEASNRIYEHDWSISATD